MRIYRGLSNGYLQITYPPIEGNSSVRSGIPQFITAMESLYMEFSDGYQYYGYIWDYRTDTVGEGYETAEARRIYRDLGRQSGKITIGQDEILVQIRSRAKAGYLIAAGYPELRQKIPWLDNKTLRVQFSRHA